MDLSSKHIFLGISGGIAAYKAVELLRLFKKAGASVTVGMTESARKFVGKITFEVLSENPVLSDLYFETETQVKHIDIAEQADLAIIAPATANIIGKIANGIADDALTTTLLAVTSPIMICPSMNTNMYQNIRVQRNLDTLEQDGCHILDPDSGALACKAVGAGRLPEPWFIFDRVKALLMKSDLAGKHILISAGPTVEAVDPVRFISNHSSGKMGYAVARAAENRGGIVTLVSGPVHIPEPVNIEVIQVTSCGQMETAMLEQLPEADIIIKVAAVADFTPKNPRDAKIKKNASGNELAIELNRTNDILKQIGEKKRKNQYLVGFAAETHDLETYAKKKITEKNLDMIAANIVGQKDSGFAADTNKMTLIFKDTSKIEIPLMSKDQVAHILLDQIIDRYSS